MVESIGESLRFMETLVGRQVSEIDRVDFFTSHEGLILAYEQAQTRRVPHRQGWYDLATHFPWIGMRTTDLGGGHVEFFRGLENPIGVKIGPSTDPGELLARIRRSVRRMTARDTTGAQNGVLNLSPREREILTFLAHGKSQREISSALAISPKTVATHIQHLLSKLGVHSRAQAVAAAYRFGLVELDVRSQTHALVTAQK